MPDDNPSPREELSAEAWSALMHALTRQAEHAMWWMRKGAVNAEEAVMSTLRTYLRQADEGELPPPTDPDSLWPVLQKQLERKIDAARATQRYKKNRMLVRYSELAPAKDGVAAENAFAAKSVSPEQVEAYVAEALNLLSEQIDNESLLLIARMKLERYSLAEIAEQTGLTEHQVGRRLRKIKTLLRDGEADDA